MTRFNEGAAETITLVGTRARSGLRKHRGTESSCSELCCRRSPWGERGHGQAHRVLLTCLSGFIAAVTYTVTLLH